MPKVAPSNHWVAKILVEVLGAHDLADIGKKNELELARVHWHAKKNGNHPNKDQSLGHDQNFGKVHFGHNPNTPQHPARRGCRGAATRPRSGVARPTASSGPETMPGRLAFSMTCGDRM